MDLYSGAFYSPIQTDVVTPSQFYEQSRAARLTPEKKLLLALFEGATHDLRIGETGLDTRASRLRAEAVIWFVSLSEAPFTFQWIAQYLDLPADTVAQQIQDEFGPWIRQHKVQVLGVVGRGRPQKKKMLRVVAVPVRLAEPEHVVIPMPRDPTRREMQPKPDRLLRRAQL